MKFLSFLTMALILALTVIPAGAEDVYDLDPTHTTVGFGVKHLGLSIVNGSFNDFAGSIRWDGKDVSSVKVEATIQVKSVDTRIDMRDKDLRQSYFEVDKFPLITFKSKKVISEGKDKAKMIGDLTIKGVTKEVALEVEHTGSLEKDPWGNTREAFKATTSIKRKDFGVATDGLGDKAVGENIDISIVTEAIKKK